MNQWQETMCVSMLFHRSVTSTALRSNLLFIVEKGSARKRSALLLTSLSARKLGDHHGADFILWTSKERW